MKGAHQNEGLNLNDCQRIQRTWEESVYGDRRTVVDRFFGMEGKWDELDEAVENLAKEDSFENRRKVAEEAIYILIQSLQIIDATGFDADILFEQKMEEMFRKPLRDVA